MFDNINIIEILKLGLPGLVFILAFLSYQLLKREQARAEPSIPILKSIRQYMYLSIFLAVLTIIAPLIPPAAHQQDVFSAQAKLSGTRLENGQAAVCIDAKYANHYLLLTNTNMGKMIQVQAKSVIPCKKDDLISINMNDAAELGLETGMTSMTIEVAPAVAGQKFVI